MGSTLSLRADYFRKQHFKPYDPGGQYPVSEPFETSLDARFYFDAEGIPTVRYPYGLFQRAGRVYDPVTVGLFGLRAFNHWKASGNADDRAYFLKLARWFVAKQDPSSGDWYELYDYPINNLGVTLHHPWPCAMAQGLAMSILTRAYALTKEQSFLEAAERGLKPFEVEVEQGGVLRYFGYLPPPDGASRLVFYEEMPTREAPSYILNGFMFALLGLYDVAAVPNAQAAELFQRGELTLRTVLPLYDLADLTAYDLVHITSPQRKIDKASVHYHMVHIVLLNALGSVTHDPALIWYRDHWNSYGTILGPYYWVSKRIAVWAIKRTAWGSADLAVAHPVALGSMLLILALVLGLFLVRGIRAFPVADKERS
jgi:heparosan-N-sulfate-glucuronate 5-epimerase